MQIMNCNVSRIAVKLGLNYHVVNHPGLVHLAISVYPSAGLDIWADSSN